MSEAKVKSISEKEQRAYAQLESLAESYVSSEGSSWEQRAQYILKFIKEYEAQVNNPTLSHETTGRLADLYKELKPIEESTRTMLQNVVNMANSVPEIGIGGDDSGLGIGGTGSGDASSAEIESLRQQLEEANRKREEAELAERVAQEEATAEGHATEAAEEKADMYRRAMDSMQEEMNTLRGRLADVGSGTGDALSTEDVENARKAVELAERAEEAYKKLEEFSYPTDISDQAELNRVYEERLAIIQAVGEENLKAHDPARYKDWVEDWNESFENRSYLMQLDADGEVYERLNSELDYNNEILVSSEKLEALLANRQALMKDINLTSEEEYSEQEEINKQIERRIALQKELEPLVASGALSREDYEDILAERGELEERQRQLGGVQQNLFNAEPEDLNEAQAVLDQYERILVKTASGKTLTLGPEMSEEDWKSFMKIDTDKVKSVEFVRKEMQQTSQAAEQQAEVQVQANDAEIESNKKKIKSYEELTAAVKEYFDLKSQLKDEFNYSGMRRDAFNMMDRYQDIDTDEGKREQMMKDYNDLWSEREKVKKSIKTGNTYISSDGQEYLGSERDIEELTTKINGLSAAYIYLGGSVDDFSSKAKKISTATSWNLFKKAEEQDLANNKIAEEFNKPIEEKMRAIEAALIKQQLDPNSLAVWSALEVDSGKFEDRLASIAKALGIEIPQAAQKAETAVGDLNNELKTAGNNADSIDSRTGDSTTPGAGTGQADGATTEEVQNLEAVRAKVAEITREVSEKTQEFLTEQSVVKRVAESEVHALGEVEKKIGTIRVALSNVNTLLNNIKKDKDIGAGLNNININVNHTKDEKENEPISINQDSLKSVLKNIVYKVKFAHDDNDKQANKIAIDEETLESTLRRVFSKPDIADVAPQMADTTIGVGADGVKAETNILIEQYHRVINTVKEWQALYQSLQAIKETDPKKLRANVLSTLQGVSPELVKMIGGKFAENFATGFKGIKTKDILAPVSRIVNSDMLGDVTEQFNILENIDFDKLDVDTLPIGQTQIDFLQEAFKLLQKIGEKKKEISDVDTSVDIDAEQGNAEVENKPWALEKTLLSAKEVLGQIQTNTAKSESVEVAPVKADVGNVLATENTLTAIKIAVEAINSKVIKGTKASAGSDSKKAKTTIDIPGTDLINQDDFLAADLLAERLKTQSLNLAKFRSELMASGNLTEELDKQFYGLLDSLSKIDNAADLSMWNEQFKQLKSSVGIVKTQTKELLKQAEQLGALQAKAEFSGTEEAKEKVVQLQKEIDTRKDSLKLSKDKLTLLEQIVAETTAEAKAEEEALLRAKTADKIAKTNSKNRTKLTKKQALTGKAGNAIGRGEGVVLEALSIDSIPLAFIERVNQYNKELDALRKKHLKISSSEGPITKAQQKTLIEQTKNINKQTAELSGLISEYQKLSGANIDETKKKATLLTDSSSISEYELQLKQYVKSIHGSKAQIKGFNAETKTLTYTVKTGKNEFTDYTAAVRHLDHQMVSVQGATKRTETFFEATKRKMKELTSYMSGMAIFSRIGQELRRGIEYVREIDLALTELRKVTDKTEEEYDQFLQTAAKTGTKLGSTISAVTEATATFAKLGYSMEQATEMAESAIVYKNVGDNIASTEDAADSIISTMKGFRLEASESMAIVDKFNETGNRFAITSQGIGEALRLSASALSEGSNSLDESIALITAANEVVNDPSSVGTALKTLTLRLRGSKTELEEAGLDIENMATTTSQLQAKLLALTGGQVDIMSDANTFKNTTQILREMAAAWEDMTDIQRAEWCPYVQKCA